MSREISADFSDLVNFVKSYNLNELCLNKQFLNVLSQQHKKYFSYLTFVAEISESAKNGSPSALTNNQIDFITESCSDIGSSIFVMSHGAYKAARLTLRSSIETFNKGFNFDEIPDIDQEKSIFIIFEKIKELPFFRADPSKALFNSIHQDYKTLCEDVHTATIVNMQHITALKYFPTFQISEAQDLSNIMTRLVGNYLSLLGIKYNLEYQKMHYRNKENILESVPKHLRPILQGVRD